MKIKPNFVRLELLIQKNTWGRYVKLWAQSQEKPPISETRVRYILEVFTPLDLVGRFRFSYMYIELSAFVWR